MNTLSTGSKGADVTSLQNNLAALGYHIAVDGDFGNGTKTVLMQFQTDNSLVADGVARPDTWAALNKLLATDTIKGIDISHNNGTINWDDLSPQIKFVYFKATQGAAFKDPMYPAYLGHLKQKGLVMGTYHFLTFEASAQSQVDNFLSRGFDFSAPGTLPPALDVEWQVPDSLNAFILHNRAACIQIVHEWLDKVADQTGRTPVIYTGKSFWDEYLGNPPGFEDYPLWIPSYQKNPPGLPPGWDKYTIWQYAETGAVQGTSGDVDQNLFNGSMADFRKFASLGPIV